jgi:hypothetical protein
MVYCKYKFSKTKLTRTLRKYLRADNYVIILINRNFIRGHNMSIEVFEIF